MDPSSPCVECEVVAGRRAPVGGILLETPRFLVHALVAPSPLEGWVVLAPRRHARWWWELDQGELAELGPLAARVMLAQRKALGAVHGYAFAIGDVLHHMHLHLVPRFETTPERLRGRGAFAASPEDMLEESVLARAASKLKDALAVSG